MNFLIVDDNCAMRTMIRMVIMDYISGALETAACQIYECSSAEEALSLCTHYAPDFVTMDLRMGNMNGFSCIRQMRQLHPAAHIVLISQFVTDLLRAHSRHIGADAYVCKDDLGSLRDHLQLAFKTTG